MSIKTRIRFRRAGGSIIATIPKEAIEAGHFRPGEYADVILARRRDAIDEFFGRFPEIDDWDRSWTRGRERF